MKLAVKSHTNAALHVILRPNALPLLLGGLLFVAAGFGVILALAVSAEIWVENGELRYEKHRLWMLSDDSFALPAGSITDIGIILKEQWFNRSYQVAVSTAERVFDAYFMADGDQKGEIAEQSLAALSRNDGIYHYQEDSTVLGLVLGLACIVGGLYCWFSLQRVVIVGDRGAGTLTIRRKRTLTGFLGMGDGDEILLAMVSGVRVKAHTLTTIKHQVTSYQVSITRKNGKPVPVAKGPVFTAASAEELKELLDAWIAGRQT